MDFDILQKVLSKGNKHGSAFNEILNYYDIKDKDLTKITNDMALIWLSQKESKEKENEKMCNTTKSKIAKYNALTKLLKWYGTNDFEKIPETAALEFLAMLESGEIKV